MSIRLIQTPEAALFMPQFVVCDLDGTLLNREHRLGDYTLSVLNRLRARGVELMLASGRHFQDVRRYAAQLGGHRCLISSNGAAVHDARLRLLDCRPLAPHCVKALIADPRMDGVHRNVYRLDDWLVARPEPYLLGYHRDSGFAYQVTDLAAIDGCGVLKVFFYGDHDLLVGIERHIIERFPGRVSTTFSLPETFEVMAFGVSKGSALERVLRPLHIDLAQVLAFGDGLNDRELLECVGTGIIMGNADLRLRQALPQLEVIGSNADEAVARYLEQRFL
jgi:Cof subfamily protein (haloacid dehalogenase superfamily)